MAGRENIWLDVRDDGEPNISRRLLREMSWWRGNYVIIFKQQPFWISRFLLNFQKSSGYWPKTTKNHKLNAKMIWKLQQQQQQQQKENSD